MWATLKGYLKKKKQVKGKAYTVYFMPQIREN